jgi:hypothetical protein
MRPGRSVHRTLYEGDALVGLVDTAEFAAEICAAVNAWRAKSSGAASLQQFDAMQEFLVGAPIDLEAIDTDARASGDLVTCRLVAEIRMLRQAVSPERAAEGAG